MKKLKFFLLSATHLSTSMAWMESFRRKSHVPVLWLDDSWSNTWVSELFCRVELYFCINYTSVWQRNRNGNWYCRLENGFRYVNHSGSRFSRQGHHDHFFDRFTQKSKSNYCILYGLYIVHSVSFQPEETVFYERWILSANKSILDGKLKHQQLLYYYCIFTVYCPNCIIPKTFTAVNKKLIHTRQTHSPMMDGVREGG